MSIVFTVLGEPVGKARQRVTRFGTYTPEATTMYENLIKTEYRRQCRDRQEAGLVDRALMTQPAP